MLSRSYYRGDIISFLLGEGNQLCLLFEFSFASDNFGKMKEILKKMEKSQREEKEEKEKEKKLLLPKVNIDLIYFVRLQLLKDKRCEDIFYITLVAENIDKRGLIMPLKQYF